MYILIFNPMNDVHCNHMIKRLNQRGIPFKELGSSLENDYALVQGNLYYNGELLDGFYSAYFRGLMVYDALGTPGANKELQYTDEIQFSARSSAVSTWLSLLDETGTKVINPPRNNAKYRQLFLLQQEGIPLPRTCITSSPEMAKSFISKVGHAVCKPLLGGSYCRRVPLDQLDFISAEPTIFQEEISGVDIRVNMLNGKVLSAHIIKSEEGVLDYRTDPRYSEGGVEYEEVTLPDEVIEYCKRATGIMELRFSGIDLRRTPEGEYYLIECNSMPAFLDIEQKTGAAITDCIIDDLLEPYETKKSNPTRTIKERLDYRPKLNYFRGKTLFDYYRVITEYQSVTASLKGKRMIVELNEKQRQDYKQSTGREATIVELEVDDEGVGHIKRIIR
jgi:hypothetical protein